VPNPEPQDTLTLAEERAHHHNKEDENKDHSDLFRNDEASRRDNFRNSSSSPHGRYYDPSARENGRFPNQQEESNYYPRQDYRPSSSLRENSSDYRSSSEYRSSSSSYHRRDNRFNEPGVDYRGYTSGRDLHQPRDREYRTERRDYGRPTTNSRYDYLDRRDFDKVDRSGANYDWRKSDRNQQYPIDDNRRWGRRDDEQPALQQNSQAQTGREVGSRFTNDDNRGDDSRGLTVVQASSRSYDVIQNEPNHPIQSERCSSSTRFQNSFTQKEVHVEHVTRDTDGTNSRYANGERKSSVVSNSDPLSTDIKQINQPVLKTDQTHTLLSGKVPELGENSPQKDESREIFPPNKIIEKSRVESSPEVPKDTRGPGSSPDNRIEEDSITLRTGEKTNTPQLAVSKGQENIAVEPPVQSGGLQEASLASSKIGSEVDLRVNVGSDHKPREEMPLIDLDRQRIEQQQSILRQVQAAREMRTRTRSRSESVEERELATVCC